MLAGVAHDIGHAGLAPTRIDLLVTAFACDRSDITSVIRGNGRGGVLGRHRRDLGQMTNEAHKLPDLTVRQIPSGHAGVTDAVADVVEKLAVGGRLDRERTKCRWTRILVAPDSRFASPIVSVAGFALLPVKFM